MTDTKTVDRQIGQLKEPPDGLRLRPYAGEQDIPFIVEATNREFEYEQMPFRASLGEMRARYSRPNLRFDARRDVTIAEIDGEPVGYGARSWVDTAIDNFREYS